MTRELYELLKSDIFTDAPEYADRVKRIRQLIECTTFADERLEREARELYATDDIEIDPEPASSEGEDGTWVAGWLWVQDSDLGSDGKPRGE